MRRAPQRSTCRGRRRPGLHYAIWRSTGSTYVKIGTTGNTTYNNTGLLANTTYNYVVTAIGTGGTSGDSSPASAETE